MSRDNNNSEVRPQQANSGSILDQIYEKAANIEQATNKNTIANNVSETLRLHARREKAVRESTISIKLAENVNSSKEIMELIEREWSEAFKMPSCTYWQDKEKLYCQFTGPSYKNEFLDSVTISDKLMQLKDKIDKPNKDGEHFSRKPVRLEISSIRNSLDLNKIKATLNAINNSDRKVTEIKEGTENKFTHTRSIYFRANANAFRLIFTIFDGSIPMYNLANNAKMRLFVKINCKPYSCKDCFKFNQHQCQGKICGKCGQNGHQTKDCKSLTKYCSNCSQRGHKAKDIHCPTFLNEVGKELRKMDVPLEYYEDKELRFILSKFLQLK